MNVYTFSITVQDVNILRVIPFSVKSDTRSQAANACTLAIIGSNANTDNQRSGYVLSVFRCVSIKKLEYIGVSKMFGNVKVGVSTLYPHDRQHFCNDCLEADITLTQLWSEPLTAQHAKLNSIVCNHCFTPVCNGDIRYYECMSCHTYQSAHIQDFTPVMIGEPDDNGMCETTLWCSTCTLQAYQ